MDVTMIGLQNAGKSSLLRVLAVCLRHTWSVMNNIMTDAILQGAEFTVE